TPRVLGLLHNKVTPAESFDDPAGDACGRKSVCSVRRGVDLTAVVGAARRARRVRTLGRATLRAAHERDRGGLPLGPAGARVAPRHLPLRDGHVNPPDLVCSPEPDPAAPPSVGRSSRAGDPGRPLPASPRNPRTDRGSQGCRPGATAARAPPRHGTAAPGRGARRRGRSRPRTPPPPSRGTAPGSRPPCRRPTDPGSVSTLHAAVPVPCP